MVSYNLLKYQCNVDYIYQFKPFFRPYTFLPMLLTINSNFKFFSYCKELTIIEEVSGLHGRLEEGAPLNLLPSFLGVF